MPIRRKAAEAGLVRPADLEMLWRVFDATEVSDETATQREDRAYRILRHFEEGIADEATLVSLINGDAKR